jgi:hypothetical protein
MSSGLAIAGVTAVLRAMLHGGMVDHAQLGSLGPVKITAEAPDQIKTNVADLSDQINLFMYHVTPNAAWRNQQLPSRDQSGNRISNPPLALDLYYLVTAYSQKELYADVLLGYAMQYLHEIAVLTSQGIQDALSTAPPEVPTLMPADLLDQVEQIKIIPYVMSTEDMSRLWMAFQTSYRPSAVYQVSVVLLRDRRPARAPLPVLTIGPWDAAAKRPAGVTVNADMAEPAPYVTAAMPPPGQPAIRMGETLTISGFHLSDGPAMVRFTHTLTGVVNDLPGGTATATAMLVTLPAAGPTWRAGFYSVKAMLTVPVPGGGSTIRTTNAVPVALAPTIGAMTKSGAGAATVLTIPCTPSVWQAQTVSCVIAGIEFFPDDFPKQGGPDPVASLNVTLDPAILAGAVPWVRLRVDDVESILIAPGSVPPAFLASQKAPL